MLHIYTTMIDAMRMLRPVLVAIERHDADLGRQLRGAASSVALNIGEGTGSTGGTRTGAVPHGTWFGPRDERVSRCRRGARYLGDVDTVLRGKLAVVVSGLLRLAT